MAGQVGSDQATDPATFNKVREHLSSTAPRCTVVKADWLRECGLRRETLPSDARFALDAADLVIMAKGARGGGKDAGVLSIAALEGAPALECAL